METKRRELGDHKSNLSTHPRLRFYLSAVLKMPLMNTDPRPPPILLSTPGLQVPPALPVMREQGQRWRKYSVTGLGRGGTCRPGDEEDPEKALIQHTPVCAGYLTTQGVPESPGVLLAPACPSRGNSYPWFVLTYGDRGHPNRSAQGAMEDAGHWAKLKR